MTNNQKIFIPTKDRAGAANKDITIAFRAIEKWANDLPTIPTSGGGGGAYASLTGPGQTTTPGDLTQAGGFTVDNSGGSSMGFFVDNAGTGGVALFDGGSGGIGLSTASSQINISSNGSILVSDGSSTGLRLQESGSGGINLTNNGAGTQGIGILDNAPAGSGTGVSISSSYKNVIIGAGGISGSSGQVILQSLLNVGLGSVNTNLIVDPNGIHIGTNHTTDVVGFFGGGPNGQQTVTGSRGGNAALASLLTGLAFYGLIVNSSTP